jgi:isoleucyl-tRNA synthetase
MREAWQRLEFHRAMDLLLDFCTVDLSAVYLDVAKDRLYTLAPGNPSRRSAQTVLWRALHDLVVCASPALVFTAEEAWQQHPGLLAESPSVHLALWPARDAAADSRDWERLLALRDAVNTLLEPLRAAKQLSTTSEAAVTLTLSPSDREFAERFGDELGGFLIVSSVTLESGAEGAAPLVAATRTSFARCDRCWTFRADVQSRPDGGALCARCLEALSAIG